MSAHSEASYGSQHLCQKLFDNLAISIPRLKRQQTKRWCALFEPGRNRFAYVSHRKRLSRIEVWCSGDVDKLTKYYTTQQNTRWMGRKISSSFCN